MRQEKLCTIDDCGGKHFGAGLCQKHYRRQKRNGTTTAGPRPKLTAEGRALALVAQRQQRSEDQAAIAAQTRLRQDVQARCAARPGAPATWRRWAGKTGVVKAFTIQRFDNGVEPYIEIGLSFDGSSYPQAWFRPDELDEA